MNHISATPFGARRLTVADLATQAVAASCPDDARANKWRILKAVSEGRVAIGISDRAAAVLHALLSFHPGEEVAAGAVVFPSNRVLSLRAHGMSAPTLRRHIAALVDAGLVIRRDSPNGKRYARKAEDGTLAIAFGFELTPLVARLAEFEAAVAALRADAAERAVLRERVSLLRRDVAKAAELLAEEDAGFDLQAFLAGRAGALSASLRSLSAAALANLSYDLGLIRADLDKALAKLVESTKTSASDIRFERHIQDSNQTLSESEPLQEREQGATGGARTAEGRAGRGKPAEAPRIDLSAVLAACPDLRDWVPERVRSWTDLVQAAERIRPALGISPDAWTEAVNAMGESGAAVTLATILQRSSVIQSPGGYLRSLSAKARAGGFTPAPIVVSLLRRRTAAGIG